MRTKSIFEKVILNNIIIMLLPVVILMYILCFFLCSRYKSLETQKYENILNEYTQNVQNQIQTSVQKSEYILKNTYIIHNMNMQTSDMTELLNFENNTNLFLDDIAGSEATFKIYTTNDCLYEGKYISKIQRLKNSKDILKKIRENPENIFWEDKMKKDPTNAQYFTFYREMKWNREAILLCRVHIPYDLAGNKIIVAENSSVDKDGYIFKKILNNYSLAIKPDYSSISVKYYETVMAFFIITAALCFFMIYLSYIITQKVTVNVDNFITQLSQTDIFNDEINLENDYQDVRELQVIKRIIKSLVVKVNEITQEQFANEIEKKNLRMNLLQSQIDPHTLYNSLAAIRLNAFFKHDDETMNLIENMVSYYHAVLNKGKDITTLKEEIETMQKYISINELSHGKKYMLKTDISPECNNVKIPHLLLQPFVENSIIHGLVGSRENCIIKITAYMSQQDYVIKIEDNGYGIDEEKLKELTNLDTYDKSIGVKNAYLRLKLAYGPQSTVEFKSLSPEGTAVVLKFTVNK